MFVEQTVRPVKNGLKAFHHCKHLTDTANKTGKRMDESQNNGFDIYIYIYSSLSLSLYIYIYISGKTNRAGAEPAKPAAPKDKHNAVVLLKTDMYVQHGGARFINCGKRRLRFYGRYFLSP